MKHYLLFIGSLVCITHIYGTEKSIHKHEMKKIYKKHRHELAWDEDGNYIIDVALVEKYPEVQALYDCDYVPTLKTKEKKIKNLEKDTFVDSEDRYTITTSGWLTRQVLESYPASL